MDTKTLLQVWQDKVLEIFNYFIELCKENNIRYYTCCGTTLGSVRHHNFIPWDDDIDVLVPRDDYERLLFLLSNADLGKYELVTPYNTKNYYLSFAKLCIKNSTIIEHKNVPQEIGLYIDIFPLDSCSDDYYTYMKDQKQYELLRNKLFIASSKFDLRSILGFVYRRDLYNLAQIFYSTINSKKYRFKTLYQMKKLFEKYPFGSTLHVTSYASFWVGKEYHDLDWFEEGSYGIFADINVVNPKEFDKYLTQLYGDYMKLPPVEKRVSHHNNVYINFSQRHSYLKLFGK